MARVKLQAGLAVVFALMAIVTAAWPEWIEAVFGVEPDGGNGSLEAAIVVALGVAALIAALFARRSGRAVQQRDADALAADRRPAE